MDFIACLNDPSTSGQLDSVRHVVPESVQCYTLKYCIREEVSSEVIPCNAINQMLHMACNHQSIFGTPWDTCSLIICIEVTALIFRCRIFITKLTATHSHTNSASMKNKPVSPWRNLNLNSIYSIKPSLNATDISTFLFMQKCLSSEMIRNSVII